MTVLTVERAKDSLRGQITQVLLELKPGVYVGTISRIVREQIWATVSTSNKHTGALMVFDAPTEQGFDFVMCGTPTRSIVSYDDIKLILQNNM